MRSHIIVLLTAVVFAGCGAAAAAPEPAATPPGADEPRARAAAAVRIAGFEFEPGALTVKAGTRVRWKNADASNHTVTFARGPGDLGNVDEGESISARFSTPGRYAYVCGYHPNMTGTVTVR